MRGMVALTLATLPALAHGATVAVAPPVSNGVDPKTVLAAHQLIASELDFVGGDIESVTDLEKAPASLNNSCLSNTACLKGIASSAGTDWLVTGAMADQGANIALDLLLFDAGANKIVRRKTWTVPNDASAMADKMTPIVSELVTGQNPNAGQGETVAAASFTDDDDVEMGAAAAPKPKPADAEVAALLAIGSLEDLDEPQERKKAGAAAAALPAAAAAAAPVAAAAAAPAVTQAAAGAVSDATGGAMSDDDVLSMISFGGGGAPAMGAAASGAANNYANQGIGAAQGAAYGAIDNAAASVPSTGNALADKAVGGAAAAAANAAKGLVDMEADKARNTAGEMTEHVNLSLRGGFSKYYEFNFATGGGEIGVPLGPLPLDAIVGIEVYAVQRTLPPEIQAATGQIFEWNTIFPMNLGLLYRFDVGKLRPYVGADGIMVQYYRDAIGSDWAGGGRARAGVDYFFTPNFGANLNLAAGAWLGQNWPLIEPGVGQSGLLPQVSAGAVLAF